jgi:hypothetical protein
MRFLTLASFSFLTLLVSAQKSKTDAPTTNELLAELTKLPKCVVSMTDKSLVYLTQLTTMLDHMHNAIAA